MAPVVEALSTDNHQSKSETTIGMIAQHVVNNLASQTITKTVWSACEKKQNCIIHMYLSDIG